MLLPLVAGYFKANSAKRINDLRRTPGIPVWQRSYYEHVIRSESELARVREYIEGNPSRWEEDPENPTSKAAKRPRGDP